MVGQTCDKNFLSRKKYATFRVKKNQLDSQLILSIFRQPVHVSGVSRPIIRRYLLMMGLDNVRNM